MRLRSYARDEKRLLKAEKDAISWVAAQGVDVAFFVLFVSPVPTEPTHLCQPELLGYVS
jgi:hypothetical protein